MMYDVGPHFTNGETGAPTMQGCARGHSAEQRQGRRPGLCTPFSVASKHKRLLEEFGWNTIQQ